MITFYMMRHGQTRFNLQGRIQGACDSPLTELGIEQAKAAKSYFEEQGIRFGSVYASTQERACDTAEIVTGSKAIIRLKGLKEMDFGAFEGQQEYLNPPLNPDGSGYGDYFMTYGGEGSTQVRERVYATMQSIMAEQADCKEPALIVSHAAAIAQFYRHYSKTSPKLTSGISNCAIFKMSYDQGVFDLLSIYDPIKQVFIFEASSR